MLVRQKSRFSGFASAQGIELRALFYFLFDRLAAHFSQWG
jgi:hypothetical protein